MKRGDSPPPDNIVKHAVIVFLIALGGYLFFFFGDSYLRNKKGPWRVTFFATNGSPAINVNQNTLAIQNVTIIFQGEPATNQEAKTLSFWQPKQPLPFGKTKFEDLTYLPGSVAFDFFGHEVELLPRTLYLNKKEHPWASGQAYALQPEEKLPPDKFYDPREKKRRFGRKE